MAGTVQDVLALSERQLGNGGRKYWEYFNGAGTYVDGYHTPWCVDYPRWLLAQCGVDFPWPYQVAWDYHDAPRKYIVDPCDLRPGIPVTFDFDGDSTGDHAGIVVSVHDWGCVTDEGNTGTDSIVRRKQRLWSEICCGIMPAYDEAKDEWIHASDGRWWYRHADGSYTRDGWERIDEEWYHFDADGWMQTGWIQYGSNWYYLSEWREGYAAPEGHMVHGGVYADLTGRCYAFWGDGRMVEPPEVTVYPHDAHDGFYGYLQT